MGSAGHGCQLQQLVQHLHRWSRQHLGSHGELPNSTPFSCFFPCLIPACRSALNPGVSPVCRMDLSAQHHVHPSQSDIQLDRDHHTTWRCRVHWDRRFNREWDHVHCSHGHRPLRDPVQPFAAQRPHLRIRSVPGRLSASHGARGNQQQ